jgi:hypothetical protein
VEFAIVAPVFFALIFSTFEVGWFYFANATLDSASINAARVLRTGQVQKEDISQADYFEQYVCPQMKLFGDCESNLTVEVRTFNSFAALAADTTPMTCADEEQTQIDAIPFQPGQDRSIVRVRLCFLYKSMNPALGLNLAKTESGHSRVVTSYILRVEPYSRRT